MLTVNALEAGYVTPVGYTKTTSPLRLTQPVTADISTYLQVAYNDSHLWSVGPFEHMKKTNNADGAKDLFWSGAGPRRQPG